MSFLLQRAGCVARIDLSADDGISSCFRQGTLQNNSRAFYRSVSCLF